MSQTSSTGYRVRSSSALFLWPLERIFPSVRGKRIFRKGFRVDVIYWFFTPTVTAGLHVRRHGAHRDQPSSCLSGGDIKSSQPRNWKAAHFPAAARSIQYLTALLAADFLGYLGAPVCSTTGRLLELPRYPSRFRRTGLVVCRAAPSRQSSPGTSDYRRAAGTAGIQSSNSWRNIGHC